MPRYFCPIRAARGPIGFGFETCRLLGLSGAGGCWRCRFGALEGNRVSLGYWGGALGAAHHARQSWGTGAAAKPRSVTAGGPSARTYADFLASPAVRHARARHAHEAAPASTSGPVLTGRRVRSMPSSSGAKPRRSPNLPPPARAAGGGKPGEEAVWRRRPRDVAGPKAYIVTQILPKCAPLSWWRKASARSASGKLRSMTGRSFSASRPLTKSSWCCREPTIRP